MPRDTYVPRSPWGTTWRVSAAVGFGLLILVVSLATLPPEPTARQGLFVLLDLLLGVVAIALLPFSRHAPLTIGLILAAMSGFTAWGLGAVAIVLISLATRRRWQEIALAGATWTASMFVYEWMHPRSASPGGDSSSSRCWSMRSSWRSACRSATAATSWRPAGACGDRGAGAGGAPRPGPVPGAHADRPRDARRPGAPDLARRDALGGPGVPYRPGAGGDGCGSDRDPRQRPPRAVRAAGGPRRPARDRCPDRGPRAAATDAQLLPELLAEVRGPEGTEGSVRCDVAPAPPSASRSSRSR
ncbi:hypothetical protein NKG05_13220 [Oerskovia sp. M15]